jgi:gentisate 1,2-dioxygenase
MTAEPALSKLYREAAAAHLQPLWVDTARYVPRMPAPANTIACWPARDYQSLLQQAGSHMPVEHADRRVFVCNNPALPPFSGTTQTLYACVQLLRPGETAPPHRHTQSAFRLILSGNGAQTFLDGESVTMNEGDFVITPALTWHGHANPGTEEVIWLDGLDNAIVRLFDATFFELPAASGAHRSDPGRPVSKWRYPWEETLAALEHLRATSEPDPVWGWRLRLQDPQTGRDPLPTMAAFVSLLPDGFRGEPVRSTDSTVHVCLRGAGQTETPGRTIDWGRHDIFTLPSWVPGRLRCEHETVLFSFSDRGAQERLECWREERLSDV